MISCWTGGGKDSGKSAMIWKECSKWQNISSHCGRHTFASIAFAEFVYTPQQVQSVTGHKNIDIIFKHYIERQAQDKRKSIESKAAAALALEKLQQYHTTTTNKKDVVITAAPFFVRPLNHYQQIKHYLPISIAPHITISHYHKMKEQRQIISSYLNDHNLFNAVYLLPNAL